MENAREAAYNWLYLEVEEQTYDFPAQSHIEDMELEEGEFVKQIMVIVRIMPDND